MKNRATKKTFSKSVKRHYINRAKSSICRGRSQEKCSKNKKCKYTSGKKRKYCRNRTNKKKNSSIGFSLFPQRKIK